MPPKAIKLELMAASLKILRHTVKWIQGHEPRNYGYSLSPLPQRGWVRHPYPTSTHHRGRVAAGHSCVNDGRIVAALLHTSPNIYHGVGHEQCGFNYQVPVAGCSCRRLPSSEHGPGGSARSARDGRDYTCVPKQTLRSAGEDLCEIIVGEVGPAGTEVEPVTVLGRRTLYGLSPNMPVTQSAEGRVLDFGCCVVRL